MSRVGAVALALVVIFGTGCGASRQTVKAPFAADGGTSSGPGSGLWGDGSAGPMGMHVGCIDGRRFAVLITVHNRTTQTITLLGGGGPQSSPGVITRVAVQVRLAPQPPKGDQFVAGLRSWIGRNSSPVAIPARRDAWAQSNFLMQHCSSLHEGEALTVNRSITLTYRADGGSGTQAVSVAGAKIILTRGPLHPSLPINQVG